MSRLLPVLVCLGLLIAFALAEGTWTERWAISKEMATATERLATIPLRIDEWEGEERELDPRQARQGEIRGSLLRRYHNRSTGEEVSVLLVCGRPGPLAVHSPEVCLGGNGFSLERPEMREVIATAGLNEDSFWLGRFHQPGAAAPEVMDVFWSWNATGDWQAVKRPRFDFAHHKVLFKLYVSQSVPRVEESSSEKKTEATESRNPAREFLGVFLPVIRRTLFPA